MGGVQWPVLPIGQNQALFSLLGTTFGSDGVTTFALPNLQASLPCTWATRSPSASRGRGTPHADHRRMPSHLHLASGTSNGPAAGSPVGNIWATLTATQNPYSQAPNATMGANAIRMAGEWLPHANMQPYLVLTFVIALQGIFPSRS